MDDINSSMQQSFNHLLNGFCTNKSSLNTDKTKSMLICSRRSSFQNFSLNISANNHHIEPIDTIKYLGLYIDKFLSFDTHIDKILSKVSQRNCLLWKLQSFIPESLAKYLCKSLIELIYTYCDFLYDGTTSANQQRLQVAQNSSLRTIKRCKLDSLTKKLHDDLESDYLSHTRKKNSLKIVYRSLTNQGPPQLNSYFELKINFLYYQIEQEQSSQKETWSFEDRSIGTA